MTFAILCLVSLAITLSLHWKRPFHALWVLPWAFLAMFWALSVLYSAFDYQNRQHFHTSTMTMLYSAAAALILLIFIGALVNKIGPLRKFSGAFQTFCAVLLLVSMPLLSATEILHWVNTELDGSEPESVQAIVSGKIYTRKMHYLNLELPKLGFPQVSLKVQRDFFDKVNPPQRVRLNVRQGWLGWKWTNTASIAQEW